MMKFEDKLIIVTISFMMISVAGIVSLALYEGKESAKMHARVERYIRENDLHPQTIDCEGSSCSLVFVEDHHLRIEICRINDDGDLFCFNKIN